MRNSACSEFLKWHKVFLMLQSPDSENKNARHNEQGRTIIQMDGKFPVILNYEQDKLLTPFGKATLDDRYLLEGESYQGLFGRVASYYGADEGHAQRIYDYMSQHWFMPATPVLSNGGTDRGLPISCFLNESADSLEGIVGLWNENVWLASRGGGIGSYWGNLRSIGESIGRNGKTSGVVPFIRVMDSLTLAISQGSLRRGSAAVYLPIWHPEIEEFIEMRRPTGGDPNRKALNLHHGVLVSDDFMRAVVGDEEWGLRSPKTDEVIRKVSARALYIRLLTARMEQGEPYIIFNDTVNRAIPEHHRLAGLKVKASNLCAEITLPTGIDHHGKNRTAVCCLSSLNLEHWEQWKDNPQFIRDVMIFLDNVLQDFIDKAPDAMASARYSAMRERSVGLGVMGFHSFLQERKIPFGSVMAKVWNKKIFKHISEQANQASDDLAETRGACPDAEEYGFKKRFSNTMAIAPTASISIIAGNASPGIDPITANVFLQKTLSGSFSVRNRHLERLLETYGKNTDEVWSSITLKKGTVQHLDFLSDEEKEVFKTAFEIDQRWIIELAGDRAPFISQAQSVNLFLPADIHKTSLVRIHYEAWKKGLKSLYYCRSLSIQRADTVSTLAVKKDIMEGDDDHLPQATAMPEEDRTLGNGTLPKYEECLSCQ